MTERSRALREVEKAAAARAGADVDLTDAVYAAREEECTLRQIAAAAGMSIEGVRKMIARAEREPLDTGRTT